MISILKSIFGSGDVIKAGVELIDSMHTSTEEEIKAKTAAKVQLLQNFAPFKLTQRVIALSFSSVFLFIMLNGVLGSLYGFIDMARVEDAKEFADSMYLGEIMAMIVGWYFTGGVVESFKGLKK